MRFAHRTGTPCPPDRDGEFIVGTGGIRVDADGLEWCCHSSPYLHPRDVARQRREVVAAERSIRPNPPEKRPSRFPDHVDLPELDSLMPEWDEDGRPVNAPDVRFDVDELRQRDDEPAPSRE